MKKFTLSILVLFFCATSLQAQITQAQANTIVIQYLQTEVTSPYLLYAYAHEPSADELVLITYNEEVIKVQYPCWVYYLNENPEISEPCQHRYLFVKADDGNLLEVITSNDLGQTDLPEWTLVSLSVPEPENRLLLFPNPTTGELRIENGELRIMEVEVFDVYGRKQKAESRKQKGNSPPFMEGWQPQADGVVINISHLQAGVYFVKIKTENDIITKKVIKN